jgi:hypothetical protein
MTPTTPLARLLPAFRCGQPDRIPIIVRGVNPYARHMNWRGAADPSYRPLIERVREVCEVEHILSMGRGFSLNAAAQVETRVELRDGWRAITRTVETPAGPLTSIHREGTDSYAHAEVKQWIESAADVERFLSLPYRPIAPDLAPYFEARAQLGEAGYVLAYLDDAIGQAHALLGSELLAVWSVEQPQLIRRLLDVLGERCLDFTRRLLEGGVSPVLGLQGQEVVVPPLMSPRRFDDLVVRYDRPIVELAHSHDCLLYVHCHGFLNAVLDRFAGMGVDILHPIEAPPMGDITLAEAKRRVGGRVCLAGNIQIGDVMALAREQIVAQTRQAIADAAAGGGFVLTLTATPFERVLSQHTLNNLLAMIDTALTYGSYG